MAPQAARRRPRGGCGPTGPTPGGALPGGPGDLGDSCGSPLLERPPPSRHSGAAAFTIGYPPPPVDRSALLLAASSSSAPPSASRPASCARALLRRRVRPLQFIPPNIRTSIPREVMNTPESSPQAAPAVLWLARSRGHACAKLGQSSWLQGRRRDRGRGGSGGARHGTRRPSMEGARHRISSPESRAS